jgi:DNA invertase Pin-like site-specific DNA recombinase
MARVALYLRVSTGEQTTANQRRALEAWAERAGHEIVAIYEDAGVSGTQGRDQRPGFDRLLKDATRRRFAMLAAWSVDRLGRSLQDLVQALQELRATGVDLFLHQQALDTRTPSGRAMFQMLGVFAEFERAIIVERVHAGLARARAEGRRLGRPKVTSELEARIRALRRAGTGIKTVARRLGCGVGTVQRVDRERRAADQEPKPGEPTLAS